MYYGVNGLTTKSTTSARLALHGGHHLMSLDDAARMKGALSEIPRIVEYHYFEPWDIFHFESLEYVMR